MASVADVEAEISAIHAQIAALRAQRSNLTSALLSSSRLPAYLEQRPVKYEGHRRQCAKIAKQQAHQNLENTYRVCAGVTAYKVKDPDPNAVDNGNVLGVRIEVFIEAKFVETYHVLFNRPSARHKEMVKIHRHTIPPCIPVRALAAKYLPLSQRDAIKTTEQNLMRFGRILRKELVSWHMRTAALAKLKTETGISEDEPRHEDVEVPYGRVMNAFVSSDEEDDDEEDGGAGQRRRSGPVRITGIEADHAVRQIQVSWSNGQVAVLEVTKDGEVTKGVVRASDGTRLSAIERKAGGRIEGLVGRLKA